MTKSISRKMTISNLEWIFFNEHFQLVQFHLKPTFHSHDAMTDEIIEEILKEIENDNLRKNIYVRTYVKIYSFFVNDIFINTSDVLPWIIAVTVGRGFWSIPLPEVHLLRRNLCLSSEQPNPDHLVIVFSEVLDSEPDLGVLTWTLQNMCPLPKLCLSPRTVRLSGKGAATDIWRCRAACRTSHRAPIPPPTPSIAVQTKQPFPSWHRLSSG